LTDYLVPVIHVLACVFLIVVVLLQTGKGADMGAVFGGGSQTLFGSGGAGDFLTRLTTGTAIAFMITSLILTWGASRQPTSNLLARVRAAQARADQGAQAEAPAAGDEGTGAADEGGGEAEDGAPAAPDEAPAAPQP